MTTLISSAVVLAIIIHVCMLFVVGGFSINGTLECLKYNISAETNDSIHDGINSFTINMFNITVPFDRPFKSPVSVSMGIWLAMWLADLHSSNFSGSTPSYSAPGNILISPISIWFALMSAFIGANGTTSDELALVLGVSEIDKNSAFVVYKDLKTYLAKSGIPKCSSNFIFANKLYFQSDIQILNCTYNVSKDEIENTDFKMAREDSVNRINMWGEQNTGNRIPNLITQGDVDNNTRLLIANAAYFTSDWRTQFNPYRTYKSEFLNSSLPTFVNMMKISHKLPWHNSTDLNCLAVEIPYKNYVYSMIAMLPYNESITVEALAANLTKSKLEHLFSSMNKTMIDLHFPQFHIEQTLHIKPLLHSLGIKEIFIEDQADLSAFTNESVYLENIIHTAFIKVGEKGSETVIPSRQKPLKDYDLWPYYPTFVFNRPFIFLIRHNKSNLILFMGLVRQPTV